MNDQVLRGYNGAEDLEALRDFIAASGISDEDIALRVYCAMLQLNQELKTASAAGVNVHLARGKHIWMDNCQFFCGPFIKNGREVRLMPVLHTPQESTSE